MSKAKARRVFHHLLKTNQAWCFVDGIIYSVNDILLLLQYIKPISDEKTYQLSEGY